MKWKLDLQIDQNEIYLNIMLTTQLDQKYWTWANSKQQGAPHIIQITKAFIVDLVHGECWMANDEYVLDNRVLAINLFG